MKIKEYESENDQIKNQQKRLPGSPTINWQKYISQISKQRKQSWFKERLENISIKMVIGL